MPCDSCTTKEIEVEQTGVRPHGGTKRMRERRVAMGKYQQTGALPLIGALGAGSKALLGTVAGAGLYEFGGGAIDFAVNLGESTFDVITEPVSSIANDTGKSEAQIKENLDRLRSDLKQSIRPDGEIDKASLPDEVDIKESVDVDTSVLDGYNRRESGQRESPVEFNRIERLTGPKDDGGLSAPSIALAGGAVIAGIIGWWYIN